MSRVFVAFVGLTCLAACDTGTPQYWGIDPVRVEARGMVFDVRVKGDRAEALRKNVMALPRAGDVSSAAAVAIAQVSGCKIAGLTGDPSIVEAKLDCGSGGPRLPEPERERLRCEGEILSRPAIELEEITLDCH